MKRYVGSLFFVAFYATLVLLLARRQALHTAGGLASHFLKRRWSDADYFDVPSVWTYVHTADQKVKPPPLPR